MTNDGLLFSDPVQPGEEDWDGIAAEAPVDENALYLELDGWEVRLCRRSRLHRLPDGPTS